MNRFRLLRDLPVSERVVADARLDGMRERQVDGAERLREDLKRRFTLVETAGDVAELLTVTGSPVRPRETTAVRGLSDGFYVGLWTDDEVAGVERFRKDLGPAQATAIVQAPGTGERAGAPVATISAFAAPQGGSYLMWRWSEHVEGREGPGASEVPTRLELQERGVWFFYDRQRITSADKIPDLTGRIVMSDKAAELLLAARRRDAIAHQRALPQREIELELMLPIRGPDPVPAPTSMPDVAASMRSWGIPGEFTSTLIGDTLWCVPPDIFARPKDGAAWRAKWDAFTHALGRVERSVSAPGHTTTWFANGYQIDTFDNGSKHVRAYRLAKPKPTI